MEDKTVMEQTISFTLGDLYGFVLGVCGLIAALAAAVAVVAKLIQKWKAPNKKQNEEIKNLNARVTKIEDRLDEGDQMFKDDRQQAKELEEDLKAVTHIIIEALQALMENALDGNNKDVLCKVKKQIDNYLISRV